MAVAGGLAGARNGIGAIPSRWATYVHGTVDTPEGKRTYRLADLTSLTHRLLARAEPPLAPVGPPAGPTEIANGVSAADRAQDLHRVVTDAVDSIDAFVSEGRPVVVHCHHGASRTGLVLRAWLMRRDGWDEALATEHLVQQWPRFSTWNLAFTEFLREQWMT